jgi:hypothetical protein
MQSDCFVKKELKICPKPHQKTHDYVDWHEKPVLMMICIKKNQPHDNSNNDWQLHKNP